MTRRGAFTIISLAVILVLFSGYLMVGLMRLNPLRDEYVVHVELAASGGLLERSEVTYRGVRVGSIKQIRLLPRKVVVDVAIDERNRIPVDTDVVVANLSLAGEQYLDFRPRRSGGPYLEDGDLIERRRTTTPVDFAELLASMSALAGQVEPRDLRKVVRALDRALSGAGGDLATLVDGGELMLASLVDLLPETRRLLRNSPVVLGTIADLQDELDRMTDAGSTLGTHLAASDKEIRALLDQGPETLSTIDEVMAENGPTMVELLADLSTVSEILVRRTPSLQVYLPELQGAAEAIGKMAHGDYLLALADIWPRESCDYGSPRHPPTETDTGGPLLHRYCTTYDPELQQRGSYNAPRPPGDDTAGPASGVDELERADWWD